MNGKRLIKVLCYLFKWSYLVNQVLGIGVLGFTIINFIWPIKVLSAAYLGKFEVVSASATLNSHSPWNSSMYYFDRITGNPAIITNSGWHGFLVFLFVAVVVTITLFYNYQLWRLFHYLNNASTQDSPFDDEVYYRLILTSKFSFLVFALGFIGSICKVLFFKTFYLNDMIVKPAFDNQVINFLWVGIALFIVAQVYKVGMELKKEQDLTI